MLARSQISTRLTVVATAAIAFAVPAAAVEIEQLLGRWSSPELDECQYADDSEGAPLHIRQQDGETLIGNYGWLCGVTDWKKEDGFLVGSTKDCGMEGGDDTFDENFVLGLNGKDELLMAKDATVGLRRCPVMQ
jgi:hypothetical protein